MLAEEPFEDVDSLSSLTGGGVFGSVSWWSMSADATVGSSIGAVGVGLCSKQGIRSNCEGVSRIVRMGCAMASSNKRRGLPSPKCAGDVKAPGIG